MRAPNIKVSIVILITGLVISGIIFYSDKTKSKKEIVNEDRTAMLIQNQAAISSDSDNDGLLDWEEVLWGSDAKNADSDNDGTTDGDEVKSQRNPLIAGPNDKVESPEEKALAELEKKQLNEDSVTAKFNNVLIKEYFNRVDQNYGISNYDKMDIINQSFEAVIDDIKITPKFKPSDLKTFNLLEEDKLISYADKFLQFHKDIQAPINLASKNNDHKAISKILRNLSDKLVLIEVPQQISADHLNLINGYYTMAESVEEMFLAEADPVLGLVGLKTFQKIQKDQEDISAKIVIFMKANGLQSYGDQVIGDGI